MLRVANLIEDARWGGPQKRITLVAAELRKLGVETTVVLPIDESVRFRHALEALSVKYISIPLHRLASQWTFIITYLFTFPLDVSRLWVMLRKGRFDLLHVSGGAWQIKGAIAGRLAGVPVIWHLNDTSTPTILMAVFRLLGGLASAYFVAGSRVSETYLRGSRLERIPTFTVPAPVDTTIYQRDSCDADERIRSAKFPRIATVANISPVKGIDILVEAAVILKRSLNDFSIFVIGAVHASQKHYFDSLKLLITKNGLDSNFYFIGQSDEVRSLLKGADIYVCSSRSEASPMAVWEAMSMGCAIVSANVGDVSLHMRNDVAGCIVPVENANALAQSIIALAGSDAKRLSYGNNAQKIAREVFDLRVIAKLTDYSYKEVLKVRKCK